MSHDQAHGGGAAKAADNVQGGAAAKPAPVTHCPGSKVVLVTYEDLVKGTDLSAAIEEAYSHDGLGILAVSGVPNMSKLRSSMLPLAHKFANLPEKTKEKYVDKDSVYQFGWSHGKEQMRKGVPDFLKGSYYNNPLVDEPFKDPEIQKKWPTFARPNVWPKEDLPEFEPAYKALGKLVVDVGALLAKHIDRYVHERCSTYPKDHLYRVITNSRVTKARLLHYFPKVLSKEEEAALEKKSQEEKAKDELTEEEAASWCGWHNDHGSLTGLVPSMYINSEGKEVSNPEPKCGLWIRSRKGVLVQGKLPTDCLAYQLGETEQIHSGGIVQATPHCVLGPSGLGVSKGVSRETLAVFMEPEWPEAMAPPKGKTADDATESSAAKFMPKGVPALSARWTADLDFGAFTDKSIAAYLNEE